MFVVVLLLLLLFCGVNLEIRKSCRAVDCAAFLAGETTSGERRRKEASARERKRKIKKPLLPPRTREKQSILQVLIVISFGLFCDDLLLPVDVFFAFENFAYFSLPYFFFPPPGGRERNRGRWFEV